MSAVKKARFAPAPHRRALLAKVHVARKELHLDDDTYRGALHLVAGRASAGDCTDDELRAVLRHFADKGFVARPKKPGARRAADHGPARKSRALWISLHHLGVIDNPAEKALEAFACRQLKCEAFQWVDQSRCYKLVEALKAMAERHGWAQGDMPPRLSASGRVRLLKLRLVEAIVARLKEKGLAGAEWTVERTAFALCGIEHDAPSRSFWTVEQLDDAARAMGAKLRGEAA